MYTGPIVESTCQYSFIVHGLSHQGLMQCMSNTTLKSNQLYSTYNICTHD